MEVIIKRISNKGIVLLNKSRKNKKSVKCKNKINEQKKPLKMGK